MAHLGVDTPGQHMWNYSRLKPGLGVCSWLFLVIWAPFGSLLLVLRLLSVLFMYAFYPVFHRCRLGAGFFRCVHRFWGWWITVDGQENLDKTTANIMVSNHVSDFDLISMWGVTPPAQLLFVTNEHVRPWVNLTKKMGWVFNPIFTSGGNAKELIAESLASSTKIHGKMQRLIVFPEGRTSGGVSVMPFFDFIFSLGLPVLPIATKVWNPWPLQMQMNGTSVWRNTITILFLPGVRYHITYMPEVSGAGLSKEDFAESVRSKLLRQLGKEPTLLTAKHKVAFGKAVVEKREKKKEKNGPFSPF